jgi:hypothetical protein
MELTSVRSFVAPASDKLSAPDRRVAARFSLRTSRLFLAVFAVRAVAIEIERDSGSAATFDRFL